MITISFAKVGAFLQSELRVLDGAPFCDPDSVRGSDLQTISPGEAADELADHPDAVLYLGDAEICPAAEGWAIRLLAMAHNEQATHIDFSSLSATELLRGNRLLARWIWHDYPPRALTFREVPLVGPPPATPAARLAAVLNHELDRQR